MALPAPRRRRGRRWLFGLLCVVALLSLAGASSWPDEWRGMHDANDRDETIRYVAQQLSEPSVCAKIPWSARTPGGVFIEPSYERSNCYAFIAGRTRHASLCWNVKRLGAYRPFTEQTSSLSCLVDALRGMNAGIAVSPSALVRFFSELGYDPDTIQEEGVSPPVVNLRDAYLSAAERPDIAVRIEEALLPSAASAPSAETQTDAAYLADMAALRTKDPRWCERIPESLPLETQKAGFRDWCRFTVASNTKNSALCREIPVPASERDPQLSLQATCLVQANSTAKSGQYGPEVPDNARIERLLPMLGYEIPEAKNRSEYEIYSAYDRFLDELNKQPGDSKHAAARKKFLERVLRLP